MADKLLKALTIDGTKQIIDAFDWLKYDSGWTRKALPANTVTEYASITVTEPGTYLYVLAAHLESGSTTNWGNVSIGGKKNGSLFVYDMNYTYGATACTRTLLNIVTISENDLPCTLSSSMYSPLARPATTGTYWNLYKISNWDGTDFD